MPGKPYRGQRLFDCGRHDNAIMAENHWFLANHDLNVIATASLQTAISLVFDSALPGTVGALGESMKTTSASAATVSLARSSYGTAQPQIEIHYPSGTHYRAVRAALYALAAKIELATATVDNWVVTVDADGDDRGRVYLELAKGDPAEIKRAIELLRKVVG